jgi:hypothetical protein
MDAAGQWIEAAQPSHPSLVDEAHVCDELFGITNVPTGVWIDEDGMIVRPPEPAFPLKRGLEKLLRTLPEGLDPYLVDVLLEARKIRHEPEKYVNAVRDWAEKGKESRFALTPDEVVMRSPARSQDVALAAAHFELGQHLYRAGHAEAAVPHFKEAHRLQPDNWTYKRQAWVFAHPLQGPSDQYDSDWLSDVREIGAENYYPALEM